MYILGINISHEAASCLLKDGEIVFYREDDRTSKSKHNPRRPNPFIYYHVEDIKKHTTTIDYIVFSSYGDSPCHNDERGYSFDYDIIDMVLDKFKNSGITWGNIFYTEKNHHIYHASNAAFLSGFEECVCLIIDGAGAAYEYENNQSIEPYREIESIYSFDYSKGLETKFKHYSKRGCGFYKDFKIVNDDYPLIFSDSLGCGVLFSSFSTEMGYNAGKDAGKIMGLASYGSNVDTYGEWFFNLFGISRTNNNLVFSLLKMLRNLSDQEQKDILKTLQEQTKKHTIHLIKKALAMYDTKNVVLSGGYFLNCVNNYHYLKEFPDINFYVDPIAHDGGTAIGAAKLLWWEVTKDKTIRQLNNLYLG